MTIFNLLGVEYNPSLYLGYPVFCEAFDEDLGTMVNLSVPAYVSCTGGIFDTYIFTEDGVVVKYYKTSVDLPKYIKTFSYRVSQYIERWYKITYLYEYDMFK